MESQISNVSLSEFSQSADILVIRDGHFSGTAKIPSRVPNRLVPVGCGKYLSDLREAQGVAAVLCPPGLADQIPADLALATCARPLDAFHRIHIELCQRPEYFWTSFPSRISESVRVHPSAVIAPNDVVIGPSTVVGPNAVILERSLIGSECNIGPGVVIGSDAFEIINLDGKRLAIPQAGGVRLGDRVTVQANTTIVRSTFGGFTEIGDECAFDCHVHVAHDCVLGKRVTVTACAEISGRVTIGDDAYLGPNVSISNGLTIGARARITIGSVLTRDVPDNGHVTGNFAIDHRKWLKFVKSVR